MIHFNFLEVGDYGLSNHQLKLGQSSVRWRQLLLAVIPFDSYKGERKEKKWWKPGVEDICVSLLAMTQSK